jgi:hypothetical protein
MGYTHYWNRDESLLSPEDYREFYAQFTRLAVKVIQTAEQQGIEIADPSGEHLGAWRVDGESVRLNGYGEHFREGFVWKKVCPEPQPWVKEGGFFDFCKTEREPYDVVVTALLLAAREAYGSAVRISSDGLPSDWEDGLRLFYQATGLVATVPFDTVPA